MISIFKELPKKWNIVKISDVLFYQEGPGVRKWQFRENGVKLLNVGNINNGKINLNKTKIYISEEEANGKYQHFLIDEGDLLIACSGIVIENFHNKIAFIKKEHLPLCLNTSTMRFNVLKNNKTVDLVFFKYYLQTNLFTSQLRKLITGSAQLNFGPSHIRKIDLPLPQLETQKKIAAILDEADKIRQLNKQLIAKYDALTQSLFLEMFGDPVTNPKGWEKVKFKEVGKLDRGKSKHRPRNAPELLGGKYPLIQTGDVANSGGYITEFKATYSEIGLAQSRMWDSGTLCITIAANIAKTGILTFNACFPDSVVGFIPNEKTNVVFTQLWISFLQKILEDSAPESAQKNINLSILRDLDFMNPPIKLQNQFAERVQIIENQKQQAQEALQKSEDLFNSLLQKAFKGELVK
jgi:type I restriction enzyme S subunit